jgi:acyl-CoA thioesterase-2
VMTLDDLVETLKAERLDTHLFRGHAVEAPLPRVFGGQVLAQSLYAAANTVGSERRAHSMHAYFLRPGSFDQPIIYTVDPIRDGRSFSTRRVVAMQDSKAIFNCSISFHEEKEGLHHQNPEQEGFAFPKVLSNPGLEEDCWRAHQDSAAVRTLFPSELVEIRPAPLDEEASDSVVGSQGFWFRFPAQPYDDPLVHQLLLTFISDYGLVIAALQAHNLRPWQPQIMEASLDHAIYFHAYARIDDWTLYQLHSPRSTNERGFARGEFFSRSGEMFASSSQEVLMRMID